MGSFCSVAQQEIAANPTALRRHFALGPTRIPRKNRSHYHTFASQISARSHLAPFLARWAALGVPGHSRALPLPLLQSMVGTLKDAGDIVDSDVLEAMSSAARGVPTGGGSKASEGPALAAATTTALSLLQEKLTHAERMASEANAQVMNEKVRPFCSLRSPPFPCPRPVMSGKPPSTTGHLVRASAEMRWSNSGEGGQDARHYTRIGTASPYQWMSGTKSPSGICVWLSDAGSAEQS